MHNSSRSSSVGSSGPVAGAAGRRTVPSSTATRKPSAARAGNRLAHSPPLSPLSSQSPPAQSAATLAPLPPAAPPAAPAPVPSRADAKAKRRRRAKAEKMEAEKEGHTTQPRRTIPTPPHRQLFLVDGFYCGADPNSYERHHHHHQPQQQHQPPHQQQQQQQQQRESLLSPNEQRLGADAAALSNRIGTAPGGQTLRLDGNLTANNTFTTVSNGVSFYVSPSVPPDFQLVAGNNNANSRGVSPTAAAAPAVPSDGAAAADGDASKSHKRKFRIKRRFYEPVELQVESLSAFIIRLVLVLWYACLLTALVIEVIPRVQWSVVNVCGSEYRTDLRYVGKWSSPCVTSTPMDDTPNVALTWTGQGLHHLHSNLVRFRRVVVSLPTPADQTASTEDYHLIANATMESGGVSWSSVRDVTLRCQKKNGRCNTVRVAEDVLAETSRADSYRFTLLFVPPSLAAAAAEGALGIAYQRSSYTVATIVWRYVLLFLSLIHALRFIIFRKFTSTLYEQGWTLTLQIALLWYLDPLFALNITTWPMPSVLAFIEYRIPTYFVAVLLAYMLSVMTASMAWSTPTAPVGPQSLFRRLKAFLVRSRNVYDPPMWTKIIVCLFLTCVFVLDIVDACVEQEDWYAAANSNVRFKRIYWSVIALLLFGGLVCLLMLLYLRNYLGNKPYLESRPQQLACRVFLMIFLSGIAYYILHCLVFFLLYNHDYSALASQQPFLQLPTLMVASFFVNIMTLVYTSQNRDDNVPINPKDPRWKHMVWPDTWYRWLARHGGSQYVFATEVEETRFYRLQFEFRKRQFMAKQKRRQQQQQQQPGASVARAAAKG